MMAYRNSEGYHDPTAGLAMSLAEKKPYICGNVMVEEENGILKIIYTEYLPCSSEKAACILPMLLYYGSAADIRKARCILARCVNRQERELEDIADEITKNGNAGREGDFSRRAQTAKMLMKRAKQNYEYLCDAMEKEGI